MPSQQEYEESMHQSYQAPHPSPQAQETEEGSQQLMRHYRRWRQEQQTRDKMGSGSRQEAAGGGQTQYEQEAGEQPEERRITMSVTTWGRMNPGQPKGGNE